MARKYRRLRYEDRRTIERMLKNNSSVEDIAREIGVHRDTIYKEIVRSGLDKYTYSADVGQNTL